MSRKSAQQGFRNGILRNNVGIWGHSPQRWAIFTIFLMKMM